MRLEIKVIPNAPKDKVVERPGEVTRVYITAPPLDNKANEHLIRFLSEYFHRPKSRIRIIQGHRSRHKTIELG